MSRTRPDTGEAATLSFDCPTCSMPPTTWCVMKHGGWAPHLHITRREARWFADTSPGRAVSGAPIVRTMGGSEIAYDKVLEVMRRLPQVCYESRRLRGWSKRELSLRAGVAPSVVTRLEGGVRTVRLDHACAVMSALLEITDHREVAGE